MLLLFIQVFIYDISYHALIFENRQVGGIYILYFYFILYIFFYTYINIGCNILRQPRQRAINHEYTIKVKRT